MSRTSLARIKVLYIAGAGRSGSTVLGNLLGQLDGFFSCGELYNIYRTPPDQRYCGCGKLLSACEIWDAILRRALGEDYIPQTAHALRLRNATARSRHALLWAAPFLRSRMVQRSHEYLALTRQLYRSIADVTGARVIVDSSKVSSYGQLLAQLPEVDLRLIFLVRDARAVAYSWQRKKPKPSPQGQIHIRPASPLRAALSWVGHNLAAELLVRSAGVPSLRVQYEQFVASPGQAIKRIVRFANESSPLPEIGDGYVFMKTHHTVEGNPDRFRTGPLTLALDDEWRLKMRPFDRALVTLLTWPLLLRYGYRP
jgi:hypothetical protein